VLHSVKDQALLVGLLAASDLYIGQWDGERWQSLPSTVDTDSSTISAKVSRFTLYSVIAK
ncbi:MAG: hypothetical protein Q8O76_09665, partial [Chloroflexota bacterium]|nr:hypothetical protein [Chloroflexota bacterium]